jgi:hypothetical protein
MRSPPSHFLFACLLTIIASGDDFNLMRVAFPATLAGAPTGGLPLDDPNTDFVRSEEAWQQLPHGPQGSDTLTAAVVGPVAACMACTPCRSPVPAGPLPASLNPIPTPLRC